MSDSIDDILGGDSAPANGEPAKSDAEIIAPKKKRGRPPGSKNAPKTESKPDITEEAVQAAWQGLFTLISGIVWLFGGKSKPGQNAELTDDEAKSDAKQLLPIAMRFPSVINILSWIGAPIVAFRRIRQKFEFKAKEPKAKLAAVPEPTPISNPGN